jgi:hypothetical protein
MAAPSTTVDSRRKRSTWSVPCSKAANAHGRELEGP